MSNGAAKERNHIGLLLAKEMAFREAAEEMLAAIPKIIDVKNIDVPEGMIIRSGPFGLGKKQSPEFIQAWAGDYAKGLIAGKVSNLIEDIGYDFGRIGRSAVWIEPSLQEKFYKDFTSASFYASLDEEKIKALGHNGVAIIVENGLKKILDSPSYPDSIKQVMASRESHYGDKLNTLIPTYKHIAEVVIERIDALRMEKAGVLYRAEPELALA